jgi:N-acetylneuraminic acid mutarotase
MADVFFLDVTAGATVWRSLPDLPTPGMVASTTAAGDMLYTGFAARWSEWSDMEPMGDLAVYQLDVRAGQLWHAVGTFPGRGRWMPAFVVCRGALYVIGGQFLWPATSLDPLESGDVDRDPANGYGYFSTPAERGGRRIVHEIFTDVWRLDLASGMWEELGRAPRGFCGNAFAIRDRWIVIPGYNWVVSPTGRSAPTYELAANIPALRRLGIDGTFASDVWALDVESGVWDQLESLPYGISSNGVATWADTAYLVGNETQDTARSNTFNTVFVGQAEVVEPS